MQASLHYRVAKRLQRFSLGRDRRDYIKDAFAKRGCVRDDLRDLPPARFALTVSNGFYLPPPVGVLPLGHDIA